jgi:hypothetical protein
LTHIASSSSRRFAARGNTRKYQKSWALRRLLEASCGILEGSNSCGYQTFHCANTCHRRECEFCTSLQKRHCHFSSISKISHISKGDLCGTYRSFVINQCLIISVILPGFVLKDCSRLCGHWNWAGWMSMQVSRR